MTRWVILLLVCLVGRVACAFPVLTGQVVDEAGILSRQTEQILRQLLATEPNHQVVVVTPASLEEKTIEEYGVELGRLWALGDKEADNGVLLIIAPNEKAVRIEVGYGLEGVLTDALSATIINQKMMPFLENGDFNQAALVGTQDILNVIRGEEITPSASNNAPTEIEIIFMLAVLGLFIYVALAPRDNRAGKLRAILFLLSFMPGRGGGFKGKGGSFGGGGASRKF